MVEKLLKKGIKDIPPYIPGESKGNIAKIYGLEEDSIIKLGSNENPLGPSKKAVAAIKKRAGDVSIYPEDVSSELQQKIAEYVGVDESQVIAGNGSDEILDMAVKMFIEAGDEAVIPVPTFSMYRKLVELYSGECVYVPLVKNFTFDIEKILIQITEGTKLVFICSPNNPTGNIISEVGLRKILNEDVVVILDEAYSEYSTGSFTQLVNEYKNLIVLRTFSKALGLAGLRVGYGIADSEIIEYMLRIKIPFSVNSLAQKAGIAALEDKEHMQRSVDLVKEEREFITEELSKIEGVRAYPSQANFVFIELDAKSEDVVKSLLKRGIIVRDCSFAGLDNHIRVTIGTKEENRKFLQNLREVL
jgi:histidinol-phosphate aminotransferase